MFMHEHLTPVVNDSQPRLSDPIARLGARIAAWITTALAHYEAAAMYERLSRLSNAELQRRGLSRATLARDLCDACRSASER